MNDVLAFIERAGLKEGDRLPPERVLAGQLGVSRRALRQHLTELELAGQIWRRRRNGTVLGRATSAPGPGLDRRLARASPDDTLEARLTVEPAVAALAATRATEADLASVENCMRRTAEVTSDEAWSQWDGAFHRSIAEATRNGILIALVAGFNAARAAGAWRATRLNAITPEKRRRSVAHHRTILEALQQRSPDAASSAMRHHLLSVQVNLFE